MQTTGKALWDALDVIEPAEARLKKINDTKEFLQTVHFIDEVKLDLFTSSKAEERRLETILAIKDSPAFIEALSDMSGWNLLTDEKKEELANSILSRLSKCTPDEEYKGFKNAGAKIFNDSGCEEKLLREKLRVLPELTDLEEKLDLALELRLALMDRQATNKRDEKRSAVEALLDRDQSEEVLRIALQTARAFDAKKNDPDSAIEAYLKVVTQTVLDPAENGFDLEGGTSALNAAWRTREKMKNPKAKIRSAVRMAIGATFIRDFLQKNEAPSFPRERLAFDPSEAMDFVWKSVYDSNKTPETRIAAVFDLFEDVLEKRRDVPNALEMRGLETTGAHAIYCFASELPKENSGSYFSAIVQAASYAEPNAPWIGAAAEALYTRLRANPISERVMDSSKDQTAAMGWVKAHATPELTERMKNDTEEESRSPEERSARQFVTRFGGDRFLKKANP